MNNIESERLRYRRQYILSPFPIDCPFINNFHSIGDAYFLYTHTDLNVTIKTADNRKSILLGDLFDYENIAYSNDKLLDNLIGLELKDLLIQISRFCGRYVIIFADKDQVYLIHDAASARKVYYYKHNDGVCCSSQPHLLAKVMGLEMTTVKSKLDFYGSPEFKRLNNSNIGNTTCYDKVLQLIPNHYLHLNNNQSIRYWPNKKIKMLPLDEVAEKCSAIIKGYMESIVYRYEVMLPVTAGKDSRLLLSTTRNFKDRVYYYINKENRLNDKSYDIVIPKKLLAKLHLDFHVIDPYIEMDADFSRIYFENNCFASTTYLPMIYNYYRNFENKINLPGVFVNTIEDVYELHNCELNAQTLAKLIHVDKYDYAVDYYGAWYDGCKDLCLKYNINVLNLLYWEERVGNWGTQTQLDKDIAQDEIIPYNSRLLIETMLSAKLSDREKPNFILFSEITKKSWPETLKAPLNPALKLYILKISKTFGITKMVKAMYYLLKK